MNHVYPFLKNQALLIGSAVLSLFGSLNLNAQSICGPIMEDFNNTGGSTAGFYSSTVGPSPTVGFTYGTDGVNGYLQRCAIPSGGTTYEIITPTYQTLASQTAVGYGFELNGDVIISLANVYLDYTDNTGTVNTVFITQFVPSYTGGASGTVAEECRLLDMSSYAGFTPGDRYRFVFQFIVSSSSSASECVIFDNFRTTGVEALIPLPVTFTGFTARKAGNAVQLNWTVAQEKDVAHYEVERSSNGKDFVKIGEVPATESSSYSFTDHQPGSAVSFYRVRNMDLDGRFKYTTIARVNLEKNVSLRAYPQPAINEVTLEHAQLETPGTLTLTSSTGQAIRSIPVVPGSGQTRVNIGDLKAGWYLVRFNDGNGRSESIKLLKQ